MGLWGPQARDLLSRVCEDDISNAGFPYMTAKPISVADALSLALRISYVGEPGWEIYAPVEHGLTLWYAGPPLGAIAAGGVAFDSLRLEKGYRLWGNDIHTEYNPHEAGIGFAVKMRKGDFIGRDAPRQVRAQGLTRKLSCMTLDDPDAVIMDKEPIVDGDRVFGYVASANYGHSIGRGAAYDYLPVEYAAVGTPVDVPYFAERIRARIALEPLYDPEGKKMRA